MMMQSSPALSLSSSFTASYSSSRLAEIAARVVEEFRAEGNPDMDDDFDSFCTDVVDDGRLSKNGFGEESKSGANVDGTEEEEVKGDNGSSDNDNDDEEQEFEFAVVPRDFRSSPTPADEIFYNGQIRPIYPVFNRNLLLYGVDNGKGNGNFSNEKSAEETTPPREAIRLPLRKLFMEERETPSCSSSEADDLDGVPPGTYCVWSPKTTAEGHCKKSNSTGSSKRWRFRDLVHRSNSDGKDRFVFLTPLNRRNNSNGGKKNEEKVGKLEKSAPTAEAPKVPGKVIGQLKNGGDRRRTSFLPYRQDLVGFFANANGFSRNLHPF